MKKLFLLTFLTVFGFATANAQILNSTFDAWTDQGDYESPDNWSTSNSISFASIASGEVLVSKDSVLVHTGQYSARLETKNVEFSGFGFSQEFPVPGMLTNGNINIGTNQIIAIGATIADGGEVDFMDYIDGGAAISQRHEKLTGFYSYSTVGTDEGGIFVFVEKDGDIIGSGTMEITTQQATMAAFEVEIEYTECGIPDNLLIVFISSASQTGQPGSILNIDNLDLEGNNTENLPPVTPSLDFSILVDQSVGFNLLNQAEGKTYDCDDYDLVIQSTTQPANGTLTDDGNGDYTYTPNAGYTGEDSFEYTICEDGNTDNCSSNTVTFDVEQPSNVFNQTLENNLLNVYPNPAQNVVNFEAKTQDVLNAVINITDIKGRIVSTHQIDGSHTSFSVSQMANGVYFYQVIEKDGTVLSNGRFAVSN